MTADLVIGIDCSTTASKVIAWDRTGRMIAIGRRSFDILAPRPGWGEQDATTWWSATVAAIQRVVAQLDPARIAALCVTHQRETFVPVDAAGVPLRPAILWLDERSRPQLAELDRRFGHDALHRLTGRPPSMTQSLPKLLWLVDHEPGIARSASRIVDVHAFLVHHLTGEWITSLASADPMGIVDLAHGRWADDLIAEIGLRPDQFCPLVPPGTVVGAVTAEAAAATGLRAGTPVVAGAGDGQAACLGAGVTGPGRAYVNLSTAVVGGTVSTRYLTDLAYRTVAGVISGTFLLETALRGGAATLSWFVERFAGGQLPDDPYATYDTEAAELGPGAGGLMLVPYWNNVMNPYWDPAATGITIGWTVAHRRHHLYRAILEGIAFEYRLGIDGLQVSTGDPITEHVVLGGGSRSALWCQMLADVLGRPVSRARSADATNLGAAILAATALDWHPSIETAATAMTGTVDVFAADTETHPTYDRLYRDVYRGLFPALRPLIDRLSELTATSEAGRS